MPSRYDRAVDVTTHSIDLAVIPILATLLSFSEIARMLAAGRGGGATFPFPQGLPTLWTYVSVPSGSATGGTISGPLPIVTFVPLFILGVVVTSALEAGFLGALWKRVNDERGLFVDGVRQFTPRIVGVNLIRFAIILVALPLITIPPLAIVLVIVLSYFVYGLPFEIVVTDVGLGTALASTIEYGAEGGAYAMFGMFHLLIGGSASFVLTGITRNGGMPGIILGTLFVAGPAVFAAAYGLLLFKDLNEYPTN